MRLDLSLFHPGPRTRIRGAIAALLLGGACALAGCDAGSSLPTVDHPPAVIDGLVVDAAGTPVPQARVAVIFAQFTSTPLPEEATLTQDRPRPGPSDPVEPIPVVPAETRLLPVMPNPTAGPTIVPFRLRWNMPVTLQVLRRDGSAAQTLASQTFPAGEIRVAWDGRDDAGSFVPNGEYRVRMTAGLGDTAVVMERPVLIQSVNYAHFQDATADAHGRFEIPLSSLPVGHEVVMTDSQGNIIDTIVLAPRVVVCATGDGSSSACSPALDLGDLRKSVQVRIQIP